MEINDENDTIECALEDYIGYFYFKIFYEIF